MSAEIITQLDGPFLVLWPVGSALSPPERQGDWTSGSTRCCCGHQITKQKQIVWWKVEREGEPSSPLWVPSCLAAYEAISSQRGVEWHFISFRLVCLSHHMPLPGPSSLHARPREILITCTQCWSWQLDRNHYLNAHRLKGMCVTPKCCCGCHKRHVLDKGRPSMKDATDIISLSLVIILHVTFPDVP